MSISRQCDIFVFRYILYLMPSIIRDYIARDADRELLSPIEFLLSRVMHVVFFVILPAHL